jgi:hypothetical protein
MVLSNVTLLQHFVVITSSQRWGNPASWHTPEWVQFYGNLVEFGPSGDATENVCRAAKMLKRRDPRRGMVKMPHLRTRSVRLPPILLAARTPPAFHPPPGDLAGRCGSGGLLRGWMAVPPQSRQTEEQQAHEFRLAPNTGLVIDALQVGARGIQGDAHRRCSLLD